MSVQQTNETAIVLVIRLEEVAAEELLDLKLPRYYIFTAQ